MTTPPTEDAARRLLAKAATTIAVDESAPMTLTGLPEPRPRRWPVLAAAAAVLVAIGGGYLVAQQLGAGEAVPADPAPPVSIPVEQEHRYADDVMPSLLGYTDDEAVELLEARGYAVQVREEHSCDQPPGYVLSTDPGPGTVLTAGDAVRVRATGGPAPNVRCAVVTRTWQQVLDLARFARGLGPAPRFPAEVSVAVGEGARVALTAEEATDPASWVICADGECHSPLAALAEILTRPVGINDFFAQTYLVVTDHVPGNPAMDAFAGCLTPDPLAELDVLEYHPPTYVYVDYPIDGQRICPPPPVLQIEWTEDRRIAGVRLRLPAGTPASEEPAEVTTEQASAADAFITWARGDGPAPAFADRVRSFLPGFSPPWNDEPESRETWGGCSGLGFPDCPIDPVGTIARYDGTVAVTPGPAICPAGGAVPDGFPKADVVRLEEPEPARCDSAWAVELWVDDEGVIYAVRQVGMLLPPR